MKRKDQTDDVLSNVDGKDRSRFDLVWIVIGVFIVFIVSEALGLLEANGYAPEIGRVLDKAKWAIYLMVFSCLIYVMYLGLAAVFSVVFKKNIARK